MAKELENCFLNEGVQGPTRQRPDFREAKHACRRLFKNMLKVPDKEISQSIQHNKEGKILNHNLMNTRNTPLRFALELDGILFFLQLARLHPRSHIACADADTFSTQHIALICYTLTRSSSCAFHRLVIPCLVSRQVSRPAQCTQHFVLYFTVLYFSFVHRLRLKVDHVQNTLRRFTWPWR